MAKHAVPPSRRLTQLKAVAAVVVVVAFVTLLVGSATGVIGPRDDDGADDAVGAQGSSQTGESSPGEVFDDPTATNDPTEIVTDVPPQEVHGAKKLKRSLEWLRRGLADETTFLSLIHI